ncbi:TetR family transcriptional regulator [Limosilactobacillus equigenerosi]|uniref:TetR family transcriptional regulator n=1 Tax=Limosilactobacillus equigenerosi TaxID=417373 RepID=UPI000B05D4CB|nr:TetR family transcriptional regulator [Limosilactobacillus equigenerosi]
MPRGSAALTAARQTEIINACEQLYQTKSFKEITLKEISTVTSFTRTSIYNYFQTKEEIFLAMFKREYDRWNLDLTTLLNENGSLTKAQLATKLSDSLVKRLQLLKLLAMNNFDMEENSRPENLAKFKASYGDSLRLMGEIVTKFCPEKNAGRSATIRLYFFSRLCLVFIHILR